MLPTGTLVVLGLALSHMEQLTKLAGLIRRVVSGEAITTDELDQAIASDNAARLSLDRAIAEARAEAAADQAAAQRAAGGPTTAEG